MGESEGIGVDGTEGVGDGEGVVTGVGGTDGVGAEDGVVVGEGVSMECQTSSVREPSQPPITHILPPAVTEVWSCRADHWAPEVAIAQLTPLVEYQTSFFL